MVEQPNDQPCKPPRRELPVFGAFADETLPSTTSRKDAVEWVSWIEDTG